VRGGWQTDGDPAEAREAIAAFLAEATSAPLDAFLEALEDKLTAAGRAAAAHADAVRRAAIAAGKASEAAARAPPPPPASSSSMASAGGSALTAAERRQREALLAQYEDGDDIIETEDGELEVVYRDHSGDGKVDMGGVPVRPRNGEAILEKQREQRTRAKDEHARKVAREKELQEREKERKEKAKQRTQRQERHRGPG
jgi:hypothetical protein